MRCACESLFELEGNEAEIYAEEHLQKLEVDPVAWTKTYVCEATGRTWLMDFPRSEEHGGGPPRLRQLAEDGGPRTDVGEDPFR